MLRSLCLVGLAGLSLCILKQSAWGEAAEDGRAIITEANFERFRASHAPFLLMSERKSNPGDSGATRAVMVALLREPSIGGLQLPIGQVDLDEHQAFFEPLGVGPVGSLQLVLADKIELFEGDVEAGAVNRWVAKRAGASATPLKKQEDLNRLYEEETSVAYFVPDGENSALETFLRAARDIDSVCAYAEGETLKGLEGVAGKFVLVHHSQRYGRKVESSEEPFTFEAILAFESLHGSGKVLEFDQEAANAIFSGEKIGVILFGGRDEPWFERSAREFRKSFVFFRARAGSEFSARVAEYVGVDLGQQSLRILHFDDRNLQKFACSYGEQELRECIADFKAGKLQQLFKSEPIPTSNDGPVRVIVGENFQKEVIDSNDHVLLEIYAPWCGHCKHLAPIYEQLAQKLKNTPGIVIAKMDGTANEVSGLEVRSFPTIKLYKKDEKDRPKDHSGERTVKGFIAYLEKELGVKVSEDK